MGRSAVALADWTPDELALRSYGLVEAALMGDMGLVEESLAAAGAGAGSDVLVDVNYIGTVRLRVKCAEVILAEERADEVRIGYEEFRTDVSALFAAAHSGHAGIIRKLLLAGADVNQELFRGYPITAAAREGHCNILAMLLNAGTSQLACEHALLEASLYGEAEAVRLLIRSEMARPNVAAHALVTASNRGFLEVVSVLVENGVDVNCLHRLLLQSIKPTMHANVDCTPLIAAVIGKQSTVVQYLLKAGARTTDLVQVGAWSWDPISGDELRVGVCLGEPYNAVWCAVEFYEASGGILKQLLHYCPFCWRVHFLALVAGAAIHSSNLMLFSPLHFIAGCGHVEALQMILNSSTAELNTLDSSGLSPIMVAARGGHLEAFRLLVMAGADVAAKSTDGITIMSILEHDSLAAIKDNFEKALLDGVLANVIPNQVPFRALHYAARKGDTASSVQLLKMGYQVNALDEDGYSPLMLAAVEGHYNVCKLLLMHDNAEIGLTNDRKETALSLATSSSRSNKKTEGLLLDHTARYHVLGGEEICKHTREGRGNPHMKSVRMLKSGVLTWGKTSRRNVICKEAAAGPSLGFLKNRRKDDLDIKEEVFRVVTVTGREVHFEARCVSGMELWVRGINFITKEAASSES
ncbi:hypothetical protein HPP92_014974 [Vanilla planifolia]|uniref:Uncharacterized protein n=1 Tax=Vanilla planifolia TaxID=51239 RepID=A0A835QQL2_VANPL|nr:hypothetical protein HPP92_014974 [Vanilla planifolia]